jgi:type IV secretion system protein TrbL
VSRFGVRIALVSLLGLSAALPGNAGVLDGFVSSYQTASSSWLTALLPIAQATFGLLATLEVATAAILWLQSRKRADEMLHGFIRKILVLGLFYAFLTQFPLWVPRIVQGFQAAGQTASQAASLSPGTLLQAGIDLAVKLAMAGDSLGLAIFGPFQILTPIAMLIVLVAFVCIAAQLVMVLVESYIVVTGGVLFLGFAAFRGSAPLADRYIAYAVSVGVRLFLLYLMTGVGLTQVSAWTMELNQSGLGMSDFKAIFDVLGGSLVFALLVWRIPTEVARSLTQGVSFGVREALGD